VVGHWCWSQSTTRRGKSIRDSKGEAVEVGAENDRDMRATAASGNINEGGQGLPPPPPCHRRRCALICCSDGNFQLPAI